MASIWTKSSTGIGLASHLEDSWKRAKELRIKQLAEEKLRKIQQLAEEKLRKEQAAERDRLLKLEQYKIELKRLDILALKNGQYQGPVITKQNIVDFMLSQNNYPIIKDLCGILAECFESEEISDKGHKLDMVPSIFGLKYGISHYFTKCGYYHSSLGVRRHCGHDDDERERCNNMIAQVIHGQPIMVNGQIEQKSFFILYRYLIR